MRLIGIILILLTSLTSCWPKSISFNDGGSMHPCLKQFYMPVLENNAPNAPINYPTDLTEAIKTGVQNNTRLLITDIENDPQVIIEGAVTNYLITPVALQEGDNSASNRLTISASFKIYYTCKDEEVDEEMNLVSTRFIDYSSTEDISAIETQLLTDINAQIVQDVINKLLSNW